MVLVHGIFHYKKKKKKNISRYSQRAILTPLAMLYLTWVWHIPGLLGEGLRPVQLVVQFCNFNTIILSSILVTLFLFLQTNALKLHH